MCEATENAGARSVKVLGTGCANCRNTVAVVEAVAKEKSVAITLEKVEDVRAIMAYGVMRTPAVVVDGKVVHAGGIPDATKVAAWF